MITSIAMAAAGQVLAMGSGSGDGASIGLVLFLSGFVFYAFMYMRYRNTNKRHMHARETEATLDNLRSADDFLRRRTRQRNARIRGANEREVEGAQNNTGLGAGLFEGETGRSLRKTFSVFDHR